MIKLHSLNRNELKYLVIIAMLIDHIAWAFVPTASLLGQIMHIIGRLTGPTMAYMLADGYDYTRIPFSYFELGYIGLQFGVIYTLLLSLLAIWLWDKGRCPQPVKVLGIIGLCILSLFGDWAIFDILYALFFFCYRNNPRKKWTAFCILTLFCCENILFAEPWWSALFQLGIFLVFPLIQFGYNGKSGSKKPFHKWFFYVFYPLHLLILGVLRWVVFA